MRLTDLLVMPVASLGQQKLRTMLTTLGVIFGAFVLAASLSIKEGVQETIDRESRKNDYSRKVTVFPKWDVVGSKPVSEVIVDGTMSPGRRERIRKALEEQERSKDAKRTRLDLSKERLEKLAGLPHVQQVIPIIHDGGLVLLGTRPEGVSLDSGSPEDDAFLKRIIAGRGFLAPDERGVLVSELLAYRLGIVNDFDLQQLIGRPLRLELQGRSSSPGFSVSISRRASGGDREEHIALEQVAAQLPAALDRFDLTEEEVEALRKAIRPGPVVESGVISEDFPVVGVYRRKNEEEFKGNRGSSQADISVVLPYLTAADLYFREPGRREQGIDQAVLLVDEELNVKDVARQVEGLGLDARAAIEFIERERLIYDLIFGGMTCVAGVALLVSALGIANTMLMSVLERQREIGIMKAVGADNRHLQFIFIIEGGLIGLVGAAVGLLLAYCASFPADTWVRSMIMRDIKMELKGSIFVFPPWIGATVFAFTVLVTTLAAYYPSRHAARVDPVTALRHE